MSNTSVDDIYWSALKLNEPGDPTLNFTALGGNSIGIFRITSEINELEGVEIDPVFLLSPEANLDELKRRVAQLKELSNA